MPTLPTVDKGTVRRFLLEKQGLGTKRPQRATNKKVVLQTIQGLECVQIDPVAAVERNQHLVLGARLSGYGPERLEQLLQSGQVFEYWANAMCVIPMDDYALFEVIRRRIGARLQPELEQIHVIADQVLKRLEVEGPLPAKAFQTSEKVHGYWDNTHAKTKATSHALNLLNDMGRIQVVRREGTTRFFDIRDRAVPKRFLDEAAHITDMEARNALIDKYIRAYRVFDVGDARFGWQRLSVSERREAVNQRVEAGSVIPLSIEGVKRPYFILSEDAELLMEHAGNDKRTARTRAHNIRFLGPLDNLLWRRDRLEDLFGFSYTWEVYIPEAKRRFGYYAMPILADDILIGRMDPRLDRDHAQLNVRLLQIDTHIRWTKSLRASVLKALEEFAAFHHAELGDIERTEPTGLIFGEGT